MTTIPTAQYDGSNRRNTTGRQGSLVYIGMVGQEEGDTGTTATAKHRMARNKYNG